MPRISGETLQQHREQLQRRVFEAFADLMAERSFDAITMAAIAERADVGRTAIYHHFPDKESVVVAFASHETEEYLHRLRDVLAEADDPDDRLRLYVRYHLAEGERFHMGLGPQLYGVLGPDSRHGDPPARRRGRGRAAQHPRGRHRRRAFTIEDLDGDDVPDPRVPEPAAPPGADDRVVRAACGGCRGLGVRRYFFFGLATLTLRPSCRCE